MAIGDNNNSNLFGTNYNAEEEERKKALLAAQNARIGAGSPTSVGSESVPASAFGQEPASNPFSVQVFEDPSFNTVKSNATDDEAFAFFQSKGVQSELEKPMGQFDFTKASDKGALEYGHDLNMRIPAKADILAHEIGIKNNRLQEYINTFAKPQSLATESVSNLITNNPFLSTSETPVAAQPPVKNALLEMLERADAREAQGLPRQAAPGIIDAPAPTIPESTIPRGAVGSPQENFRQRMLEGETLTADRIQQANAFAESMGTTFDPLFGYAPLQQPIAPQMGPMRPVDPRTGEFLSQDVIAAGEAAGMTFPSQVSLPKPQAPQAPIAPMGQDATRAALGGMTLNEYLNAPAGTEGVSGLRTDPQGRMITPSAQPPVDALSSFEKDSLARQQRIGGTGSFEGDSEAREARIDARPDFGEAVSDRDRRAARGDGISMADQTAMAKANARGASPSEVARGNQVANALGVDLKTGQPLQATGSLTFDQQLALRKQNFAEGKFDYELAKDAQATYTAGIEASQKATTEEAQADTAGRTMVSAISNMNDAMTRMGGRSGEFFGSGFFGKAASFMPGTSAYDQVADVEFLQSNVALNAMSELKELSPTGSTGFGALSEKELRVLTDKYANLNPFTSPGLFQSNLKQLQGEFNNMLNNAWNKHSKEYSPEAANAIYGNRGGSASSATGAPSQAVPNDRNVASAADTLLSDPKYN